MSQDNEIYSPSKLEMMEDIQVWVADQTGQNQDNIEVLAIDRRLKVPSCSTEFDVSFPTKKVSEQSWLDVRILSGLLT